uniref:Uncharacterized protein n=1 Tax=Panthera leo TaxID=9689 RepID=A0A8C8XDX2_PANLE
MSRRLSFQHIYEKPCFFREGQFVPWFTKLENFTNQIVAIKKESTWKWIRTKHVINRMVCHYKSPLVSSREYGKAYSRFTPI